MRDEVYDNMHTLHTFPTDDAVEAPSQSIAIFSPFLLFMSKYTQSHDCSSRQNRDHVDVIGL